MSERITEPGPSLNFDRILTTAESFLYPSHKDAWVNGNKKSLGIWAFYYTGMIVGMGLSIPETGLIRTYIPEIPSLAVFLSTYFISTISGSSLGYRLGCKFIDELNS
ncbi:hypothetical protein A3F00_03805 [Candidatus Daviesbacteria bacterium RIFCSPHIGHO2_12_FULL_37_11]|uniref:Uncharacterized protein n=1 Tax=Candidatus Daviesbacteria bacterium RIFCSPHIGHO2_12_FULL_37_11 TaxID=1797777 RepID=A0A1F5KBQ6_9BACT|nr:MAG: hypothetical protein A3F00_03805 [Candidatus Daviesbacteria bacterium RIFCSPHIGHO2_12_FULL_37_11]OGE45877.1 MAG: hypothetical protein A3B39_01590 [Candidatus Daviesbacteria bacterium RIFCSPLOWO2_01_FULL_37_10]